MLTNLPTPLEPANRLAAALGLASGRLWLKREDLTGLATGGNKARKLELLVADAVATGSDTLVTAGGLQSNHARLTAAAAARMGLGCVLVFNADPPLDAERHQGNQLLDDLFGADRRFLGPMGMADLNAAVERVADDLRSAGRRPYPIPLGGSNPLGASAYARAADETVAQLGHDDVLVVTASASGGTQAGLAARLGHERVIGVDVGALGDLAAIVRELTLKVAQLGEVPAPKGEPRLVQDQVGDGYGAPTSTCREAIQLAARTEGVLLDPVYSGKAFAGLIGLLTTDLRQKAVVFLVMGGVPALFVDRYRDWLAA